MGQTRNKRSASEDRSESKRKKVSSDGENESSEDESTKSDRSDDPLLINDNEFQQSNETSAVDGPEDKVKQVAEGPKTTEEVRKVLKRNKSKGKRKGKSEKVEVSL